MADVVCITGVESAKRIVTYQGAHAARPADEVDVDSFIGVKSHRAKGKRITTYDVESLSFLEPELPPQTETAEPVEDDAPEVDLDSMNEAVAARDEENPIEEPAVEVHEHVLTIDSEQLNLF